MPLEWDLEEFRRAVVDELGAVDELSWRQAKALATTATAKMRAAAPVDEGDVLDSIDDPVNGGDKDGRYYEFGPRRFTARFTEYGTVDQPARPWIRPSIEQAIGEEFGE